MIDSANKVLAANLARTAAGVSCFVKPIGFGQPLPPSAGSPPSAGCCCRRGQQPQQPPRAAAAAAHTPFEPARFLAASGIRRQPAQERQFAVAGSPCDPARSGGPAWSGPVHNASRACGRARPRLFGGVSRRCRRDGQHCRAITDPNPPPSRARALISSLPDRSWENCFGCDAWIVVVGADCCGCHANTDSCH